MTDRTIDIQINEQDRSIHEGLSIGHLRDRIKPGANVLLINGFPCEADTELKQGDRVVFLRRGETPGPEDLESLLVARHTPGVHSRMKGSVVGIAGLGGLGSNVAIALVRMGIGTLILADFDVVEPSNLNRQQYSLEHVGAFKIDAMVQILLGINPYLNLINHKIFLDEENIQQVFDRADIVVECLDRAETKAMFIQTVLEFLPETYIIGASGLAGYGASNSIQSHKLGERLFMVGDLVTAAEPGMGLMAPRVGIAAHHQANLAVSLIVNGENVVL
jgi:sulfur carrier protein ThiS adenylyltransferase